MVGLDSNLEKELKKHHTFKAKIEFLKAFFGDDVFFEAYFLAKNNLTKKLLVDIFPLDSKQAELVINASGPFQIEHQKATHFFDSEKGRSAPINTIYPLSFNGKIGGYLFFASEKKLFEKFNFDLFVVKQYFDKYFNDWYLQNRLTKKSNELKYKNLEIESLINITNIIHQESESIQALLEELLFSMISVLDASKGMILVKDENSGFFNVMTLFNVDETTFNKKIIRETKGILKEVNSKRKSLLIKNTEAYPLLDFAESNALVSPIFSRNELEGAIILADKESRTGFVPFSTNDLRLFDSLSKKISLAYDNWLLIDSLKGSQKLVDSIMSSITTGIIKINVFGEIEYLNDAAKKTFGLSQEGTIGNHYLIVFENNPEMISLIETSERQEEIIYRDDIEVKNNNASQFHINLTLSPVYDQNKKHAGVVLSLEDLSDINKVKSTFKKYVSESIVDELFKNETSLELGGSQKEVSVLFCDIRGFTAMSEKMTPSEVVSLLNRYFQAMIDIVFKHNGTLDKIIGDELMVLFGAPLKGENDAKDAVECAIEMFDALEEFNQKMMLEKLPTLNIGVGLNHGKVISGNIGSEKQMNYTVIGDPVNLAARLCSHAKPGEIVISETVFEKLEEKHNFIEHDPIFVKGKTKQIKNWILKIKS